MTLSVLIVDDSDVIRTMIERTLRLAQLPLGQVYHASNGKEALSLLAETWVDLVMADINMPVMNGAEMLAEMRSRPETADVPVIVVSTEGASERIDELMRLGVSAWVRKPFTPEEIRDVVERVLHDASEPAEYGESLDRSLALVFEQFAFTCPEPAHAESLPEPGEDLMVARISFVGAASGSLVLATPTSLCVELAANALGTEPGEPGTHIRGADTLGEILNMACGHLATTIDADRPTDIQPPIVARLPRHEWDRIAGTGDTRCYLVEDQPVLAQLGVRMSANGRHAARSETA